MVDDPQAQHESSAARNQSTFRAVNEQVVQVSARGTLVIVCECADTECDETLELTAQEYEAVRSRSKWFAVRTGHVYPDVERILSEHDGYTVVEKVRRAGEVAEASDPRG